MRADDNNNDKYDVPNDEAVADRAPAFGIERSATREGGRFEKNDNRFKLRSW